MPNAQVLNFMNQPSINEQVDAQDMAKAKVYTDVRSSMAETQMQEMKNASMREQGSILKNFEGQTDTQQFKDKMNTVNPELVQRIEKHAATMDINERNKMKERYTQLASDAIFEVDRLKKSGQGKPEDFKQLYNVISKATTIEQAMNMTGAGAGPGKGKARGGMKAADENAIHNYTKDLFKGIYNPATGQFMGFKKDTSRQQAAKIGAEASRIVANNPQITLHEAVMQAAKMNGVQIVPKEGQQNGKGSGKDPLGLR